MPRSCSRGLLLLAVLAGGGCALTAKKPDSPAGRLDSAELASRPVPPGERYYLLLFGSQDALHRAKFSHTWATLVRATCTPGAAEPALEAHTISWLPATLDIHPFDRTVEPGVNLGLDDTITNSLATKQGIDVWGPYEVSYPFAVRFLTQKGFLDSGAIGYQCDDSIGEAARTGRGCDCIHAVSDLDPIYPRWRYPLVFYGPSATANILRRFMHSPVFIQPRTTHDWIIPRLGLTDYPLRRRAYLGRADAYTGRGPADFDRALPAR